MKLRVSLESIPITQFSNSLECDDECRKYARNLRFALALHIENPDLSGKIVPRYPDSMKQWVKKDPEFCQMVHDKLTELVKLSKEVIFLI